MDRKALLALREQVWVTLWPNTKLDLEVCLVPAEMPDLSTAQLIGTTSKSLTTDLCTNAFVDFRGYVEDGNPVPNTLENRVEFYGFPAARAAINNQLQSLNVKVLEGEDGAVSD